VQRVQTHEDVRRGGGGVSGVADHPLAGSYNSLGVALSNNGELDEAITALRKAIAIQPDHVLFYNNLGRRLVAKGKVDEGIAEYRKAIELQPDYAYTYYNLGIALGKKGNVTPLPPCTVLLRLHRPANPHGNNQHEPNPDEPNRSSQGRGHDGVAGTVVGGQRVVVPAACPRSGVRCVAEVGGEQDTRLKDFDPGRKRLIAMPLKITPQRRSLTTRSPIVSGASATA
jgi:tetratricopeptide (TPR) repeat protein